MAVAATRASYSQMSARLPAAGRWRAHFSVRTLTSSPVPVAVGKRTCARVAGFDLPPLLHKVRITSVTRLPYLHVPRRKTSHGILYRIASYRVKHIALDLNRSYYRNSHACALTALPRPRLAGRNVIVLQPFTVSRPVEIQG